jgi:hypothetical protein
VHKAAAAAWILSRLTTAERAESVVGDCLEEAEFRGVFWFWKAILGSAVAFAMSRESRASWRLLPEVIDQVGFMSAIYLFSRWNWWQGFAACLLTALLCSGAVRLVFPGFPVKLKGKERWAVLGAAGIVFILLVPALSRIPVR